MHNILCIPYHHFTYFPSSWACIASGGTDGALFCESEESGCKKAVLARLMGKTVCWLEEYFDPKNGIFIIKVRVFFLNSVSTSILLKAIQKLCFSPIFAKPVSLLPVDDLA